MFKQIQDPIYYKHYVAETYRIDFEKNPYDNIHFLDDRDNPNLGIFYDSRFNSRRMKEAEIEDDNNLKAFKTKLSIAGNGGQKGTLPNRNRKVSTYPNFISTSRTETVRNLHLLRPKELEEHLKPKLNYFGKGTRKTSHALAVLTIPGTGKILVNNRELTEYFIEETGCAHIVNPLRAANKLCEVDVHLYVTGGGITGQSQAGNLAVSKAIIKAYPDLYQMMHERYFLYSDNRQVEPKKTGRYKARKSWTYVRR